MHIRHEKETVLHSGVKFIYYKHKPAANVTTLQLDSQSKILSSAYINKIGNVCIT